MQGICSKKQCWLDESCLTSFGSCPGKGRGFGTTQNRVLIIGTIFSVPYVSKTCFLHTQNTCCTFLMQYLYNLKLCTVQEVCPKAKCKPCCSNPSSSPAATLPPSCRGGSLQARYDQVPAGHGADCRCHPACPFCYCQCRARNDIRNAVARKQQAISADAAHLQHGGQADGVYIILTRNERHCARELLHT